jgi:hypothetical protein
MDTADSVLFSHEFRLNYPRWIHDLSGRKIELSSSLSKYGDCDYVPSLGSGNYHLDRIESLLLRDQRVIEQKSKSTSGKNPAQYLNHPVPSFRSVWSP